MDRLIIGTVLKPQGIRGEVKVRTFTDTPEDFKKFKTVVIGDVSYKVLSFRTDGEAVYLMLRGVADRDAAELLRGKDVESEREDAPELEEGTYYVVDIIGCLVIDELGKEIGRISDVITASTDVYVIDAGGKNIMFPTVKGVVVETDIENKRLVVNRKRFEEVAVF